MSPDPFFQPDAIVQPMPIAVCGADCGCGPGGFCGARIHPDCLRISGDGAVRVGLSAAPEDWFAALPKLGRVLHLSRNDVAVLGQISAVPALSDWRNPVLPRDGSGSFTPNLAEHASLWAVREPSPVGLAYGFEVRDVSGQAFQRIVLTAPANRDWFERFVTEHQSPPEEAVTWFSPNHVASAQRRRALTGRIPFLRAQLANGAPHVRRLPPELLPEIFRAVIHRQLPLRTTHYTPALVRAVIWTPQVHELSSVTATVEFFSGDQTGLHLFPAAISEVWLWQGRCDCCANQHWTIEIADRNGHIALAITVGEASWELAWREMLTAMSAAA